MKAEYSPIDRASSVPLILLLRSGVAWLALSGVLGLVAAAQLISPHFLDSWSFTTYGRVTALAETSFVYGWLANAGVALALWSLGRLSGEPLRGQGWALGGWLFWNLGVLAALVGIVHGDSTGFTLLGLPRYVHLVLLFSYAALAVPGILAWSGRQRKISYASQWYAVAALFLFPWILSVVHVTLFAWPARGVLQPIIAGWYAQCAWTLWIAPLVLSVAYFVVPKETGKVLPSYEFASLGFWTLIFVGGLTGGRHLIGGPVPAWIPALAVVSCALLLFHTFIVFLNLRGAVFARGVASRLISIGLAAYILGALVDAVTSFHSVAEHTQFTYFDTLQQQLALYAGASTVLFGGIYFALPRITGNLWTSAGLVRAHVGATVVGLLLLLISLGGAYYVQSQGLLDAKVSFATITAQTRPWLLGAFYGQAILLVGNIALLVNLLASACWITDFSAPATFNPAPALETSAT